MTAAGAPARTLPRAVGLAALTLWLPALLPIWIGPLRESPRQVWTFLAFVPLLPAVALPVLTWLDGVLFYLVGAAGTLALFGGVTAVMYRVAPPWSGLIQTAVVLVVGTQAFLFAYLLRM